MDRAPPSATDSGVDDDLEDVDGEVRRDDADRPEEHGPEDQWHVRGDDRIDGQLADPGPAEDSLDHDHAAEEEAEVEPDLAEHRPERVADGVAPQDRALADAFRARRPDVVAMELVEHR